MDNKIVTRIEEIYNEWQDDYSMEITYGSDEGYGYIKGIKIYEKGNDKYRMLAFNNTDLEWYGFLISMDLGFFEAYHKIYKLKRCKRPECVTPKHPDIIQIWVDNIIAEFALAADKNMWLLEALWITEES